jgi:hypothetical protein
MIINSAAVTRITDDGVNYSMNDESHFIKSPAIVTTVPISFEKRSGIIDM